MILAGLQNMIVAASGFSTLAGTRLYPVILPESIDLSSLAAATYQIVGGSSDPTFQSSGMQKIRIQFDCFGATYAQADGLRDALRLILNGFSGTLNDGTRLQLATLIQPIDGFSSDSRLYRCCVEYYLMFCFTN